MFFILLQACAPTEGALIDSTVEQPGFGWVDEVPLGGDPDDPDPIDWALFENATLRIVSPASGDFVPLDQSVPYEVELLSEDGEPIDGDFVFWSSSADPGWDGLGTSFQDDSLGIGLHDITAEIELPNGDRLAHTVGGVRVQHETAGTYSGLFSVTGLFEAASFTCSGNSVIAIDAVGEVASGTGNCLASLVVFDLPLDFVIDLDVDPNTGELDGTAGADILGLFTYDFPASGVVDGQGLSLAWSGSVLFIDIDVDATLDAERLSLDPL